MNETDSNLSIAEQALAKSGATPADYINGLNEQQKQAVLHTEGPLLVLAGAGTGKTRVLTTRIAHILAKKLAWNSQILAVTFTNKAAHEMEERVQNLLGSNDNKLSWLGTFHSIGAKMLRANAELVGLTNKFTIIDTDDQLRILKQLMEVEGIDKERWPARFLIHLIDTWKNNAMWPENINKFESEKFAGKGKKLYQEYQARLLVLNACDFGDLLLHPIRILQNNPDILTDYQKKFRYILVDEYQDTNTAQYLWLRLLASNNSNSRKINICCVGDDDQAIYGWRGAQVKNILNFEKEFDGTKIIRLERNYRSTASILACASHLISHNNARLGKTLYPDNQQDKGDKVRICCYGNSYEESASIAADIESFSRTGEKLNDMAILVRATFQMREFENRFVEMGLDYRVFGGPRFYERLEIRDAIAYFRLTHQLQDDLAFERIINKPKRGLGDATLKIIRTHARSKKISMTESTQQLLETQELKTKQKDTLKNLLLSFSRWRNAQENMELPELAKMILEESDYARMWQSDSSIKAPERLENLRELVNAMQEFQTMQEFLDHVSLVMENTSGATEDAITLSTLHAAKGLEFTNVFLPGWEVDLFPHKRSLDEPGGMEEERRLAYVGITRAKKKCFISFAKSRFVFSESHETFPSPFINELSQEHIEIANPNDSYINYERTLGNNSRKIKVINSQVPQTVENNFELGERVFHSKFGYGIIVEIDGDNFRIAFEKSNEKMIKISFISKVGQEPTF